MPLDFREVEVKSTRYIRPESARELLSKQAVIDPIAVKRIAGYSLSFLESEQMRNNYTQAMLGLSPGTAERLRSDLIDAMVYGFDQGDPDGSWSTELTTLAEDVAQFRNDPTALDTLVKRLTDGYLEREMKFYMDSSAVWVAAYKEIVKHPVKNWIRATCWMIRQQLRKKQPAETA